MSWSPDHSKNKKILVLRIEGPHFSHWLLKTQVFHPTFRPWKEFSRRFPMFLWGKVGSKGDRGYSQTAHPCAPAPVWNGCCLDLFHSRSPFCIRCGCPMRLPILFPGPSLSSWAFSCLLVYTRSTTFLIRVLRKLTFLVLSISISFFCCYNWTVNKKSMFIFGVCWQYI